MIGSLIGIILLLVIVGVIFWAGQRLLNLIPMEEPFRTIIYILFVVLAVVIIIYVFIQLLALVGVNVPMFEGRYR